MELWEYGRFEGKNKQEQICKKLGIKLDVFYKVILSALS